LKSLQQTDKTVFDIISKEYNRERNTLELIASENFVSPSVLEATGGIMTNKYAEGYPGKRYYGGCEFVDDVENLARERAKQLFNASYVNVQPHSGSQANMAVLMTFLNVGDTVMGLDLAHGGHLTHGSSVNFSGKLFNFVSYRVSKKSGTVNFDEISKLAKEHKPKLIICGGTVYPRYIEFEEFKSVANDVGAFLMADIAHPAGLVATGLHPSPMPFCDVVTATTHKTLRGPRGGMILMGKDKENTWGKVAPKSGRVKNISELIDSTVMPGIQGGPLMHVIAAKAVAFKEALQSSFKDYTSQIVLNAKALAGSLKRKNYDVVSGGTDTHVILIDLTNKNITGKAAENVLEHAGITVNKNMVPFDERSPFVTSGIRLGTPAITTRGMKESQMETIAEMIDLVLQNYENEPKINQIKNQVCELCNDFPLYQNLYSS